eukprot:Lithocolla_globosa_v1_NODE_8562_length_806_cov_295.687084.p2 type:complete len:225 gc:universal NODE_8562_length_806_cov_295.687084:114-788(+)
MLALLALVGSAIGHGHLTQPTVRPDPTYGSVDNWLQQEPVFTLNGPTNQYTNGATRCHDFTTRSNRTTVNAGEVMTVDWRYQANHPGDCVFYLSTPDQDQSAPEFWVQIARYPGCGELVDGISPRTEQSWQIRIPSQFPRCDDCVLRWEWHALQQVSNVEFYVLCTDLFINGPITGIPQSDIVRINGIDHLPANADGYRKVYNGEGPGDSWIAGPPLASIAESV